MSCYRFLVLGSNSFSGSYCVKKLLDMGYYVWGSSRSNQPQDIFLPYKWENDQNYLNKYSFTKIDLNLNIDKLLKLIDDNEITHVINFAAQGMVAESWLKPLNWYRTNLLSNVALVDELRKRKKLRKYVHITTPEVYGDTKSNWVTESNIFAPSTPYAVSRAACDLHLLSFFKAYDFPVVFTRSANVYGPGQQLYRLIPRIILSCTNRQKFYLHGGGVSERSFIHITDTIDATIKLSLEGVPGESYHISTNETISIKKLVEKVCRMFSLEFEDIVSNSNERLGKDQSYFLNSNKLRNHFNWEEKYTLNDGILETVNWIRNNNEKMKKLSWDYCHKN